MNKINESDDRFSKILISVEESLNTMNLKKMNFSCDLVYEYLKMMRYIDSDESETVREEESQ